jgi:hypothetical protein
MTGNHPWRPIAPECQQHQNVHWSAPLAPGCIVVEHHSAILPAPGYLLS